VDINKAQLTISGTKLKKPEWEYIHRGLAYRDFEQTFALAEYMEVISAEVIDGLLIIQLERVIPESLKPRRIAIK
jgi:molecular chaperone IbpA